MLKKWGRGGVSEKQKWQGFPHRWRVKQRSTQFFAYRGGRRGGERRGLTVQDSARVFLLTPKKIKRRQSLFCPVARSGGAVGLSIPRTRVINLLVTREFNSYSMARQRTSLGQK